MVAPSSVVPPPFPVYCPGALLPARLPEELDEPSAAPPPPQPRLAAAREFARVALHLLPSTRVAIAFPPTCAPVAAAVAACAGAEQQKGAWSVPACSVSALCATLRSLPSVETRLENPSPLAAAAMDHLAQSLLSDQQVAAVWERVPCALRSAMFPFQREGVKYVIRRQGRALVGDEMGLGKTVQAIALLACYASDWPALVLCPSSLRDTWAAALDVWLPQELRPPGGAKVLLSGAGVAEALRGCGRKGIVICPYSLLIKAPELFRAHAFGMVVADESHCLKSNTTQRTKAALPLLSQARRCVCLTGTPALSRPIELFSQLQALQPRLFRGVHDYAARFCAGGRFGYAQGCSNVEELHGLLGALVLVRRLKRDVLDQLPPKIRTRIILPVQPSRSVQRLVQQLQELALGQDRHQSEQLMNQLYVQTAEMKAPACAEYLETLLEGAPADAKFLYFAHHSVMLNVLAEALGKARVPFITIVGSTPVGDRAPLVQRFQTDASVRVALLSIKAAGVGLTLTAATTVVFGELTWTPGDVVQAEDRAHRIGQKGSVAVHILQAPGTVDDFLWAAIQNKLDTLGQVLDGAGAGMQADTSAAPGGRPGAGGGAGEARPGTIAALFGQAAAREVLHKQQQGDRAPLGTLNDVAPTESASWEAAWGGEGWEAEAKRPRTTQGAQGDDWGSGW